MVLALLSPLEAVLPSLVGWYCSSPLGAVLPVPFGGVVLRAATLTPSWCGGVLPLFPLGGAMRAAIFDHVIQLR